MTFVGKAVTFGTVLLLGLSLGAATLGQRELLGSEPGRGVLALLVAVSLSWAAERWVARW